uniref:Ribonuclease H protein At1g65750 family n=1 Tax=Cajanus cajan TaxID=3821 RepID=A0A151RCQ0_CAJCA|nr:Putative ribonuclease H protein At1g65750 family [Cajanus cajan]
MIWLFRNKLRFKNVGILILLAIPIIISVVSLFGSFFKWHESHSIGEFRILKYFLVPIHPLRLVRVTQVDWHPHACGFIKCNIDGGAWGSPGHATSGGLFRDNSGTFLGGFVLCIGVVDALKAKLVATMLGIKYTFSIG